MALFTTTFMYQVTPGGTNQYTISSEVINASATGDATDDTIAVDEEFPFEFDDVATAALYDGTYTYLGVEQSLGGYVALGPDDNYYVFSNQAYAPNQNFNIQQTPVVVCFLAGTMIATPDGETAVEHLSIGDLVVTADGRSVPVKWIGLQTLTTVFGMPDGRKPVCVAAGALGEGLPTRDLRLTSDHALLMDGLAIQAGALVNDATIRRIPASELGQHFVVYHVETASHDAILANGVAAETFVDNVSRHHFDNFAEYEALFGAHTAATSELDMPRVKSARQVPAAIRERLATIAAKTSIKAA